MNNIGGSFVRSGGQYFEKNPFQSQVQQQNQQRAQQKQQILQQAETGFNQTRSQAMAEDADTVAHENAHASLAGSLGGGISYDYRTVSHTMPDGSVRTVSYRAGGHVPISIPGVGADGPLNQSAVGQLQQTLSDLGRVQAAANAPHNPSAADMSVAATASSRANTVHGLISKAQSTPEKSQQALPGRLNAEKPKAPGNRLDINA